jgi:uncharacterized protein (DUF608 family)
LSSKQVFATVVKIKFIMKKLFYQICIGTVALALFQFCADSPKERDFNSVYGGENLSRIAFPIGGMGAGMFCIEGSGAISHVSVRHRPQIFNEPCMFAAIYIKGIDNGTKVLEGQSPEWKRFGLPDAGNGLGSTSWGLPRFKENTFLARFPFAEIELKDKDLPVDVRMKAWSPFIPTEEDNSSLPVGAIEYTFHNTGKKSLDIIFSYTSKNFMSVEGKGISTAKPISNGFILTQTGTNEEPHLQGDFAIFTDDPQTKVNHCLFRGGWWDPLTMSWNDVSTGTMRENEPVESGTPGASLSVPLQLKPGERKTLNLYMTWYVPYTNMQFGGDAKTEEDKPEAVACCEKSETAACCGNPEKACCPAGNKFYRPWYSNKFKDIQEVVAYWLKNYNDLKSKTQTFTDAFYASTLPAEVIEAVAANLTIIKSPTVLRQFDGKMWGWEGCCDNWGCCHGSCTHVWNYAQAIPHLFPAMERSLRETEFMVSQNRAGHQTFRSNLPIRPVVHDFYSAADGQLGGIMKAHREWRIYGNTGWLKKLYPNIKRSMDYCISVWDPRETGALEEPHHNTYDIEFWGPNGMCTSFYTGALQAITLMGKALDEDVSKYETLLAKSKVYMEDKLYDGEYFIQDIRWKDLNAPDPTKLESWTVSYSDEAKELLIKEGPKYQYGTGCLSDGILGSWISLACGMPEVIDKAKITSHLVSIHKYNLKKDLRNHANPQRPTFAMGNDGGLLLCSWPKGGKLQLPFVYSDEVWTGIEYQVASHLMFEGEVEKGLEIVRTCRKRFDGRIRNPFNEYECGSWYARAMASYGLIEGLTGVRYDAVDGILYIDSRIGSNFTSFISTNTGFGNVGLKNGKPFLKVKYGIIPVKKCIITGKIEALHATP